MNINVSGMVIPFVISFKFLKGLLTLLSNLKQAATP